MIELRNITKEYTNKAGYKTTLFEKINLTVEQSIISSILAPAGSGKSTLLKIVSRLEPYNSGELINCDNIIYIPSEPSSFPWLNVKENILLGIKKDEMEISNIVRLVGLEGYENHFPNNKSLGFRFRIALARSIIRNPRLICLDEPFNKLDSVTKYEVYNLLSKINLTFHTTFMLATTNISEALFLSNKIYFMKKNPGQIISSMDINFSYKRNFELFQKEEFILLRNEIEKRFKTAEPNNIVNFSI